MESDYYTTGEKEFLLKIARQTLERSLLSSEKFEPQTVNKKLWENRGVFITLEKNGELRGCMGNIKSVESLILSVRDTALLVASDPRFEPLSAGELDDIKIEVSILSELESVKFEDIKPGDGVFMKKDNSTATYLPQVWKSLKDKDKFLSSLCEKAGIADKSCNSKETEFWKYTVIKFSEK